MTRRRAQRHGAVRCAAAVAAVLCAIGTSGCTIKRVYASHPLDPEALAAVGPGMPKSAVLRHLGPPDDVAVLPTGSAFVYYHEHHKGAKFHLGFFHGSFEYGDTHRLEDAALVLFDRHGIVTEAGSETQPE